MKILKVAFEIIVMFFLFALTLYVRKLSNELQTVGAEIEEIETAAEEIETAVEAEEPAMRYLGKCKITGYDTCAKCCGKVDDITASGAIATVGKTCAAPKDIPFGTKLYIDGIGERIVEDMGGFGENVIDVLCKDHSDCYAITGYYDVYIMEG